MMRSNIIGITLVALLSLFVGRSHSQDAEYSESLNIDGSRRLQAPSAAGGVQITGLNKPTSVHWDPYGNIYVLEKAGIIKRVRSWISVAVDRILDISLNVSSFGDHGFTSILWDDGYLYGTYTKLSYEWGPDCPDYGQMDGRPRDTIEGCDVYGRLSRWPVSRLGQITGPEEVILDTSVPNADGVASACCQFSTHSTPACVVKDDEGYFYVSMGDGAAFTTVDPGDLGPNPCQDTGRYIGAFRSQDPNRWNGKVLRLDPETFEPTVMTTGHRNPYRMTNAFGNIYATETGWYTEEEVNLIAGPGVPIGRNLGWPCREGIAQTPEYWNLPTCLELEAEGRVWVDPVIRYDHPQIVAPMVSSISGVAGWNNRFYYCDYAEGWIKSRARDGSDASEQTHMRDVYCTEMRVTDDNVLIFIDHNKGTVEAVTVGGPVASPTPGAVATAQIIPLQESFQSYIGSVTFGSESNIAGREGAVYTWTILFLTNCGAPGPTQTCGWTYLFESQIGATLTFNVPWFEGVATLEIHLTVNTALGAEYGYAPAEAIYHLPSEGSQPCTCGGVRTPADMPPPPPGEEWEPGPGGGGGVGDVIGRVNLPEPPLPGVWPPRPGAPQPDLIVSAVSHGVPMNGGAAGNPNNNPNNPNNPNPNNNNIIGWSPGGESIGWVVSSPNEDFISPTTMFQYRVYVFSNCARNSCGWTYLYTSTPARGRVLNFSPPNLMLPTGTGNDGLTLAVFVRATNADDGTWATGVGFLASVGSSMTCTCAQAAASHAFMTTVSEVGKVAGQFNYAGIVVVNDAIPTPLAGATVTPSSSPTASTSGLPSQRPIRQQVAKERLTDSKEFIVGISVAAGALVVAAAIIVGLVAYRKRNVAAAAAAAAATPVAAPLPENVANIPIANAAGNENLAERRGIAMGALRTAADTPKNQPMSPSMRNRITPKGINRV